jgi:hypothetical protein
MAKVSRQVYWLPSLRRLIIARPPKASRPKITDTAGAAAALPKS